jgi:hypothetical protein
VKWRAIVLGIIALLIMIVAYCDPQGSSQAFSGEGEKPASFIAASGDSRTSSNRRVTEQKKLSQEELAKQFIVEADQMIAEKRISFGVLIMNPVQDQISSLAEQMDRQTVLRLLDHYPHWNQDVYVCGVCCHLLSRLAQLAPEEVLSMYDQKIGFSKMAAILKLSDEEEEEDLEKNPKAIPTLSVMALASGYQAGKPGSRQLLSAFKETIPWKEITRVMAENDESLVGENGMLCMMIFIGLLAEECKVQPEFALAELHALPVSDTIRTSFLGHLVEDEEIPVRVLQNDVESHLKKTDIASDEQQQLALSFARRVFGESPIEAEQWLAQHKLPLKERSAHELDTLLKEWTPDNHATFQAWTKQLDRDLRARIASQKMEQLCVSIANSMSPQSELSHEYEMLDSLRPYVSSPQRLLIIKKIPPRDVEDAPDDDKLFGELLRHLKFPEADIQKLLEEKNKAE